MSKPMLMVRCLGLYGRHEVDIPEACFLWDDDARRASDRVILPQLARVAVKQESLMRRVVFHREI